VLVLVLVLVQVLLLVLVLLVLVLVLAIVIAHQVYLMNAYSVSGANSLTAVKNLWPWLFLLSAKDKAHFTVRQSIEY